MKIRIIYKLLLLTFLILAINGITGYFIFKNNQKLLESERWVRHTEQVIEKSIEIQDFEREIETSSREERDMVESYHLGANSYVVKPIDIDQFRNSIKALGQYWAVINQQPPSTKKISKLT